MLIGEILDVLCRCNCDFGNGICRCGVKCTGQKIWVFVESGFTNRVSVFDAYSEFDSKIGGIFRRFVPFLDKRFAAFELE